MSLRDVIFEEDGVSTKGRPWKLTCFPHVKLLKDEPKFVLEAYDEGSGAWNTIDQTPKLTATVLSTRGQYIYFDGNSFKIISEIVPTPTINKAKNLKSGRTIAEEKASLPEETKLTFYQINLVLWNNSTPALWYVKGSVLSQFLKFEEENGMLLGSELILVPLKKTKGANSWHVPVLKGFNDNPSIDKEVVRPYIKQFKDCIVLYNTVDIAGDDNDEF